MPYTELYCHLVWATKGRLPFLVGTRARMAEAAIKTAAREQGSVVYAVGTMPDHVHMAASYPAMITVAELAKPIKGSSSRLLNRVTEEEDEAPFAWQAEYEALSFGKRSLPSVVTYIRNQAEHHGGSDLWNIFELTERPFLRGDSSNR